MIWTRRRPTPPPPTQLRTYYRTLPANYRTYTEWGIKHHYDEWPFHNCGTNEDEARYHAKKLNRVLVSRIVHASPWEEHPISHHLPKPPATVEAVQLTTAVGWMAIANWCGGRLSCDTYSKTGWILEVDTWDGETILATHGNWIVKRADGRFNTVRDENFQQEYREEQP